MKVGIIGTAGRKEDADKLDKDVFARMTETTATVLIDHLYLDCSQRHLMSGGAAYGDHVAVKLFNERLVSYLTLALPCAFDTKTARFYDDGSVDWHLNPGGTCNYYHRLFSKKMGFDSMEEIANAIDNGAQVVMGNGLFDRNRIVAQADAMIAMTFGHGAILKDGGTKQTMDTYLQRFDWGEAKAYHIDLNAMNVFAIT